MSLKIKAAVFSHIGDRGNNEDNFYFNGLFMPREQMNKGARTQHECTEPMQIYAVCDGMGGAEFGEEASLTAVQELKAHQQDCEQPDSTAFLDDLVDRMSHKIDSIAITRGKRSGACGSTLTMLIINDWYFRTVNVGDSRIYRLRDGKLTRLTHDDSEIQRMIDAHQLTEDEAWMHPRRNVILKHLGMPTHGGKLRPTVSDRLDLSRGDRFMICSDGVCDVIKEPAIQELLRDIKDPGTLTETIAKTALECAHSYALSSDNITCIIVDVLDISERSESAKRMTNLRNLRNIAAAMIGVGAVGTIFSIIKLIMG